MQLWKLKINKNKIYICIHYNVMQRNNIIVKNAVLWNDTNAVIVI